MDISSYIAVHHLKIFSSKLSVQCLTSHGNERESVDSDA